MNNNKLKMEIESLVYWYRNLKEAIFEGDKVEINRCDRTIKFIFNQLDDLKLSYRKQNDIINILNKNIDIDINSLIKEVL